MLRTIARPFNQALLYNHHAPPATHNKGMGRVCKGVHKGRVGKGKARVGTGGEGRGRQGKGMAGWARVSKGRGRVGESNKRASLYPG